MAHVVTLNLVVSAEIERRLKKEAKENSRSMSGQLRFILNQRYGIEKALQS